MSKLLMSLCVALCLVRTARAWNAEGHMVVALIAHNHLDSAVKAKCDALVAVPLAYADPRSTNFVTAAVWADDYKNSLGTGSSHFINLTVHLDGTTNIVAIAASNVVSAITAYIATLQNANASQVDQATALRYLLHYVGDIEQPLHCVSAVWSNKPNGDAGGNGFNLSGTWDNLHFLWDDGGGYLWDSISRPLDDPSWATLSNKAAAIEAAYLYSVSVGSIPDPMDWALEGKAIAETNCYVGITLNGTPSASYLNTAQATTQQRMAIGGQRLAKLLSTILVTNAPSLTSVSLTNSNLMFQWNSVPGRTYRIQWKPQLSDPGWNDLTNITATSSATSFTEPTTGNPQRFYRAIVVN